MNFNLRLFYFPLSDEPMLNNRLELKIYMLKLKLIIYKNIQFLFI